MIRCFYHKAETVSFLYGIVFCFYKSFNKRTLWPSGLRRRSAVAGIAGLNPADCKDVRLMCLFVWCIDSDHYDELITRTEESYRAIVSNCVIQQLQKWGCLCANWAFGPQKVFLVTVNIFTLCLAVHLIVINFEPLLIYFQGESNMFRFLEFICTQFIHSLVFSP
jgi:hypothetical protein